MPARGNRNQPTRHRSAATERANIFSSVDECIQKGALSGYVYTSADGKKHLDMLLIVMALYVKAGRGHELLETLFNSPKDVFDGVLCCYEIKLSEDEEELVKKLSTTTHNRFNQRQLRQRRDDAAVAQAPTPIGGKRDKANRDKKAVPKAKPPKNRGPRSPRMKRTCFSPDATVLPSASLDRRSLHVSREIAGTHTRPVNRRALSKDKLHLARSPQPRSPSSSSSSLSSASSPSRSRSRSHSHSHLHPRPHPSGFGVRSLSSSHGHSQNPNANGVPCRQAQPFPSSSSSLLRLPVSQAGLYQPQQAQYQHSSSSSSSRNSSCGAYREESESDFRQSTRSAEPIDGSTHGYAAYRRPQRSSRDIRRPRTACPRLQEADPPATHGVLGTAHVVSEADDDFFRRLLGSNDFSNGSLARHRAPAPLITTDDEETDAENASNAGEHCDLDFPVPHFEVNAALMPDPNEALHPVRAPHEGEGEERADKAEEEGVLTPNAYANAHLPSLWEEYDFVQDESSQD